MFGGKQLEEIKEILENNQKETSSKIDELTSSVKENHSQISSLSSRFSEELSKVEEENKELKKRFDEELGSLVDMIGEFERSIASFNNIKNRLDEVLYRKINEIADTELNSVRKRLSEFNTIQDDFSELVTEVNKLKSQISKFNQISENIKEVDFTLSSHKKDISHAERAKLQLEQENDRLKSMMAKMKRGARRRNLR